MRISTTFFLALLLSGLSAYYFLSEKPSFKLGIDVAAPKVLSLSEGDSLSFLQIQNQVSKETISIKRKGSDWVLVSPVYYPAENFLVEGMAQALTFSRRERRFSSKNQDEKEFGFDSPTIKISIKSDKDPQPRTLLIGGESPVKAGVYARWEGENETFMIPSELKASFERTVYSLRRKKLFRLRWDEVRWFYAKVGARKFRLEKKEGKWYWVIPQVDREIPLEEVSDFIYSFQSLYIKEFLDGRHPGEKEFNLQAREIFLAAGGEKGEEKLTFGAPAKGKDARYASREGEDLVFLVSDGNLKSLLELFEVTLQEWQSVDRKKTSGNSATDSKRSGESEKESV